MGLGYLSIGTALACVAMATKSGSLVGMAIIGLLTGAAMYWTVIRRNALPALEAPQSPPTAVRETRGATAFRLARWLTLVGAAGLALALLADRDTLVAGVVLGTGGSLLIASERLDRWQKERSLVVLCEPRTRWDSGTAFADRRDFYVEAAGPASN